MFSFSDLSEPVHAGMKWLFAVALVGSVVIMVVPMPAWGLDLLLTADIAIALLFLVSTLSVENTTDFSAFPSLLVCTTLFRLALNVSSTRLILLDADAGRVIESFGRSVVGADYRVGAAIFAVVALIHYIVIAKGAERISEVAARFSLDALPGKQRAIDSDRKIGAYGPKESRRKRQQLHKESQLYGALDGAMKFVKGDAIAGLGIIAVNLSVGLAIGIYGEGMALSRALDTYVLLAIGDGLVSQLPAFLTSISAGLLVTRIASDRNSRSLLDDLVEQFRARPEAFALVGALIVLVGILPGFPTTAFLTAGTATGLIGGGLLWVDGDRDADAEVLATDTYTRRFTHPVSVRIGPGISADLGGRSKRKFDRQIRSVRTSIQRKLGLDVGSVNVEFDATDCKPRGVEILIHEVPVRRTHIPTESRFVERSPSECRNDGFEARTADHPVAGKTASWVRCGEVAGERRDVGISAREYVEWFVEQQVCRNAASLVGVQETKRILQGAERDFPALVDEVVPQRIDIVTLNQLFKALIEEGISLRRAPKILEHVATYRGEPGDLVSLLRHVRTQMSAYLTHRFGDENGTVRAIPLSSEIQKMIREGQKRRGRRAGLNLPVDVEEAIVDASRHCILEGSHGVSPEVIVVDGSIRRATYEVLAGRIPETPVLAESELREARSVDWHPAIEVRRVDTDQTQSIGSTSERSP